MARALYECVRYEYADRGLPPNACRGRGLTVAGAPWVDLLASTTRLGRMHLFQCAAQRAGYLNRFNLAFRLYKTGAVCLTTDYVSGEFNAAEIASDQTPLLAPRPTSHLFASPC